MILEAVQPMPVEEVLRILDVSREEAAILFREAKTPADKPELTVAEIARIEQALPRLASALAGRDWRRADGADRGENNENSVGRFDVFHKTTGEHKPMATFGDLVRWSESEYGWKT